MITFTIPAFILIAIAAFILGLSLGMVFIMGVVK
jgi:hypothetical protein